MTSLKEQKSLKEFFSSIDGDIIKLILTYIREGNDITQLFVNTEFDQEVAHGEIEKDWKVTKSEFLIERAAALNALKLVEIEHEQNVLKANSKIANANELEEIPGVRVRYFISEQLDDFFAVGEVSEINIGKNNHRSVGSEYQLVDEDETPLSIEDVFEEVDKIDFDLMADEIVGRLSITTGELSQQIDSLVSMRDQVEKYEYMEGVAVSYYYDRERRLFGFAVDKKRAMGFAQPIIKKEPRFHEEE